MQTALAPSSAIPNSLHEKLFRLGWENGQFSDVTITALGASYPAHRILLSQSPYFESLLRGPWLEASNQCIHLHIDDPNIESDTLKHALQFLYGRDVVVDSGNVFGILAVGSFLGLEPMCQRCVDFAVGDLTVETFGGYYTFSRIYEYGDYTRVMRWACLDFLRLHGFREARGVLKELEEEDLVELLKDDDFWMPTEEMRFELVRELVSECMKGLEGTSSGAGDGSSPVLSVLKDLRYEHMVPGELERSMNAAPSEMQNILKAIKRGSVRHDSLDQDFMARLGTQLRPPAHIRSRSDSSALDYHFSSGPGCPARSIRLGIEFSSISDVYKRKGLISKETYYAGSQWHLRLVERRPSPSAPPYIGCFIHRRQANGVRWGFCDRREDIRAMLRVRVGWASCKIEKECEGRFNAETWDSYGWPQFMRQDALNHCLERDGSLRIVVTICLNN